jgi:acyl carrier protein
MPDLKTRLRCFIMDNYMFGQDDEIRDTDSFLELGIIDSTGILELVSHLEEEYALRIEPEEIIPENFDSLDKLAAFLRRKQPSAALLGSRSGTEGRDHGTDA